MALKPPLVWEALAQHSAVVVRIRAQAPTGFFRTHSVRALRGVAKCLILWRTRQDSNL
jgi:hypothetical protein